MVYRRITTITAAILFSLGSTYQQQGGGRSNNPLLSYYQQDPQYSYSETQAGLNPRYGYGPPGSAGSDAGIARSDNPLQEYYRQYQRNPNYIYGPQGTMSPQTGYYQSQGGSGSNPLWNPSDFPYQSSNTQEDPYQQQAESRGSPVQNPYRPFDFPNQRRITQPDYYQPQAESRENPSWGSYGTSAFPYRTISDTQFIQEELPRVRLLTPSQEEEEEFYFDRTRPPFRPRPEQELTVGTLEQTGLTQQLQNPSLQPGEAVLPDVALTVSGGGVKEVKTKLRLFRPVYGNVPVDFYTPRTLTGNFMAVLADTMVPFVVVFYVAVATIGVCFAIAHGFRAMKYFYKPGIRPALADRIVNATTSPPFLQGTVEKGARFPTG